MAKKKQNLAAELAENRRGIQSVEVGIALLRALRDAPGALTLSAVSEGAGMPASKAHRYLASYVRAGLVRQDPVTRRYELGPFALSLGLAALSQLDLISLAGEAAREVTEDTGLTSLLCVWANHGAVIVRWARGAQAVITSLALGSVLPPLSSATGQVMMAHLPRSVTADAVKAEQRMRQQMKLDTVDAARIEEVLARVRRQGCSWVDGGFIPGLRAFACPVLDYQQEAAAAITLISSIDHIADPKHPAARALMERCAKLKEQAASFALAGPRRG